MAIGIPEVLLRLVLACVLGGAIGFERTKRLKEAGIRTHCIIATASCLMMMVSIYGFEKVSEIAGVREADPARIAAQVISGISFLGAGVIFKNGNSVKGLTTAAGIWSTSGVGLAIGCGMYLPGVALALLVVGVQLVFHHFSIGNDVYSENDLDVVAEATERFRTWLSDAVRLRQIQVLNMKLTRGDDGKKVYTIRMRTRDSFTVADMEKIMERFPEIRSLSING